MSRLLLILTTVVAALAVAVQPAAADGPPFELAVKRAQRFGGSAGALRFSSDGFEYRTRDRDEARRWPYDDVKQVQILSPTRIRVLTYEHGGRLRLGADRTFDFTVVRGGISSELVGFLLDRIDRPVVTAVMPQYAGEPLYRLRVRHQRQRRGSEGTLLLFDRQLVYLTEQDEASRFWRFADLESVLRLDRFRLQISAYEGGSGRTRPFVFELKADLPEGFYDAVWARVNPPALDLGSSAAGESLASVVGE